MKPTHRLVLPLSIRAATNLFYVADGSGRYLASSIGNNVEAAADLAALYEAASIGAAAPEVARVLDAVSLWLTGEGRALAQMADARIKPATTVAGDILTYTPDLEGLIADVEGLRATLGVAS